MLYEIHSTRGVVERLIQHEAKSSAVSDTRPQPECHKSRRARLTYIKWGKIYARSLAPPSRLQRRVERAHRTISSY